MDNEEVAIIVSNIVKKFLALIGNPVTFGILCAVCIIIILTTQVSVVNDCGAKETKELIESNKDKKINYTSGGLVQLITDIEIDGKVYKEKTCGIIFKVDKKDTLKIFLLTKNYFNKDDEEKILKDFSISNIFATKTKIEISVDDISYVQTPRISIIARGLILHTFIFLTVILFGVSGFFIVKIRFYDKKADILYNEQNTWRQRRGIFVRDTEFFNLSLKKLKKCNKLLAVEGDSTSWYKAIDLLLEVLNGSLDKLVDDYVKQKTLSEKIVLSNDMWFENKNKLAASIQFLEDFHIEKTVSVFTKTKLDRIVYDIKLNLIKLGIFQNSDI